MGVVFRLVELLLLAAPLIGLVALGLRAWSAAEKRRAERADPPPSETREHPAESSRPAGESEPVRRRETKRAIEQHNRIDQRWLVYEMDVARLLDFPMMTDMKEPLTMRFHKAKLRADMLRPVGPGLDVDELLADRDACLEYREAVQHYVTAFDVAEAEAIRRRRSDFSKEGQQRLSRAQRLLRLAADSAASPQERQSAYDHARKELDGLLVLPATTRASIERGITGEIEG
jgi:hypothetical protein